MDARIQSTESGELPIHSIALMKSLHARNVQSFGTGTVKHASKSLSMSDHIWDAEEPYYAVEVEIHTYKPEWVPATPVIGELTKFETYDQADQASNQIKQLRTRIVRITKEIEVS